MFNDERLVDYTTSGEKKQDQNMGSFNHPGFYNPVISAQVHQAEQI